MFELGAATKIISLSGAYNVSPDWKQKGRPSKQSTRERNRKNDTPESAKIAGGVVRLRVNVI